MKEPENENNAADGSVESSGLFGIWRVDYMGSSQLAAIPTSTQDVRKALPLIKDALPKPPWESYSGLVFLGTVSIPNVEEWRGSDRDQT